MRNNTCPACNHSYRSRYHSVHCGKKSLSEWRASRNGTHPHYTPRRTAGEIFASQSNRMAETLGMPVNTDTPSVEAQP